ncbi:VCBS repeat-containing protein, partial [Porticoccaceae bacterium]|nr:VCBS repeat-containing protein [Porticoccaceae bacterium]
MTSLVMRDQGGDYHQALGSDAEPGKLSISVTSDDKTGIWEISFLAITDNQGNRRLLGLNQLIAVGLPASISEVGGIEIIGGVESTPPTLSGLSINKASFDVSQAAQTIIFTVDAFDESGINWSSTVLAMKDQGGSSHYARGSDEEPGKLFLSVNSSDQEGIWEVAYLALKDTLGNRSLFMIDELLASGFLAYISEVGGIEIIGGVESTPPTLSALTLNKASFDVSQAPQTIIFTVDAFDESGINWSAGPNKSNIIMQDQQFGYHYAIGDDNAPGTLSVAVTQNDNAGRWKILRLQLTDSVGNKETVQLSDLELLGLPSFVYVLAPEEEVTDLSLIAGSQDTAVAQGADFTRVLNIENLADTDTDQLTFELSSTNMSVQSVSLISGSSSCSISTVNYNSTVSCSMSGVPANTSKSISVNFKAGIVGVGSFNANVVGALPDISYLDNYLSAEVNVVADGDGDGIADVSDNCADTANSNQVDTDSDGSGDACDVDDDGDGVLDANDAYPLISLNGLTDTDFDGLPNECDPDCLDTGMTADTDDDNDLVLDDDDTLPLDSEYQYYSPIVMGALDLHDRNFSSEEIELFSNRFAAINSLFGKTSIFLRVVKRAESIEDVASDIICTLFPSPCSNEMVMNLTSELEPITDDNNGYRQLRVETENNTYQIIFVDEFDAFQNQRALLAFRGYIKELIHGQLQSTKPIPDWWFEVQEEYLSAFLISSMQLSESFDGFHQRIGSEIPFLVSNNAPLDILEGNYTSISAVGLIRLVHDFGMKSVFIDFYDAYRSSDSWSEAFEKTFSISPSQFSESLEYDISNGFDFATLREPNDLLDSLEEPWRGSVFSARALFDLAPLKLLASIPYSNGDGCATSLFMSSHEFGDFNGDGYQDLILTADEHNGVSCSAPTSVIAIYGAESNQAPVMVVLDEGALGERDTVVADINGDGFDDLLVTG